MAKKLAELLGKVRACPDATDWGAGLYVSEKSYKECPRGAWLIWLAGSLDVDMPLQIAAAIACVHLAMDLPVKAEDSRLQELLNVVEYWDPQSDPEGLDDTVDTLIHLRYSADRWSPTWWLAHAVKEIADAHRFGSPPWAAADDVCDAAKAAGGVAARSLMESRCADAVRKCIPYKTMRAAADRVLREADAV